MKGAERLRTKVYPSSACSIFVVTVSSHLVVRGSVFGQSQNGGDRDGQMVSTNVEDLGTLNVLPDLGLLQVVDIVEVRSGKVGAERAVVAGDDNTATASRSLLIVAVQRLDAGLLVDFLKCLAVLVLANAANVYSRVLREDVLCTAGRVLGSSTGDEHGVVVLDQVFEEPEVLLLSEDSIIGLEAVLLEQLLVTTPRVRLVSGFSIAPPSIATGERRERTQHPGYQGEGSPEQEVQSFPWPL